LLRAMGIGSSNVMQRQVIGADLHDMRTMQVELQDIASRTAMLTLAGPNAHKVLAALGADQAADLQPGQHMMLQAEGSPAVVAATRTLGERDFTLIADEAVAGKLWKSLVAKVFVRTAKLASATVQCLLQAVCTRVDSFGPGVMQGAVAMGETAWQQALLRAGRPRVRKTSQFPFLLFLHL
jgi:Aminomethyltransferase folate-binding domain